MKIILTIALSLFLGGCQTIVKTIYGGQKPAVQTAQGITRWLNREGLRPENVVSISPEDFTNIFIQYCEGLKVFSADGYLLPIGYKNGKFCPQDLTEVLATLKPLPRLPMPFSAYSTLFAGADLHAPEAPQSSLQFLFAALRTLQGDTIPTFPGKVDYIVLVPFALSVGSRFQTKDMRAYAKALSENPHSRFSIWYLNFDKQAWWGEDWNRNIVVQ